MEEDEDDFYGGAGNGAHGTEGVASPGDDEVKAERMDYSDGNDEEEEEDSDDDVQFTLEKPPDAPKTESTPTTRTTRQQAASQERISSTDPRQSRSTPPVKSEQRAPSTSTPAPPTSIKGILNHDGKEGKDFPEHRHSKVDVTATPTWPATGKPITELDLDADIAESSRLWRLPGTDQTDFFNYGFDEYTWAQYCLRQQSMSDAISDQKQQDAQMKAMFGGGGANGNAAGPNAGMPPGMPPMPGMPSPDEFFQQMMASGMNPGDQNQFMQMMMGGGMPGMPGAPSGPSNQQGGGFGGNTASPQPPMGQGFQPPSGPGGMQGDQGFGGNTDGYSAQQLAIMQQQQGGGGRGRGRRGRGYY
ncbi:hypothetical protein BDY17DRAFT_323945 [Neohortaea acidophila]|uniref:Pre-mRNA polyadenylation factor Fip1 domain-containing protein n=1 Tax=Neohortaea acidophila TaxID=245834 RepID=A0A6A6PU25_9PEZI|nr:uncharacterized protein BDY17DRAFT_323945 [Neohortaea acidophila]KAF2483191.1 hypothetical protein BDY17DRAFT_323945 [Neohortaea acidophila]